MFALAAAAVLGPEAVADTSQSLGGEDFAWFLSAVPGALARLGTRTPGTPVVRDLHQPTFDVDEQAIAVGVRVMAATALTALWGGDGCPDAPQEPQSQSRSQPQAVESLTVRS